MEKYGDDIRGLIRRYLLRKWQPELADKYVGEPATVQELLILLQKDHPDIAKEFLHDYLSALGGRDQFDLERQENIRRANREFNIEFSTNLALGLPPEPRTMEIFKTAKADDIHPSVKVAHAAVEEWFHKRGTPLLTLVGPPGVGKSHLLEAAVGELDQVGEGVLYRSEGMLMDEWRYAVGQRSVQEYTQEIFNVPWLVYDEMGLTATRDAGREFLDRLIDWRWRLAQRTLIATNMHGDDIPARIASRLQDQAVARVMVISAPDYRQRGA